ncbi:MAG: extracellular solute-binding protein [Opitutaceae bacterium]|jgi:microcin C transport system substrate-binding protein|nr:extracellular solute-binding protein [Opitutaceae bacterium]
MPPKPTATAMPPPRLPQPRPPLPAAALALAALLLAGCGGAKSEKFPPRDCTAEKEAFFKYYKYAPDSYKQLMSGLGSAKTDTEKTAALDEYREKTAGRPLFLQYKTPADLPEDLPWEDGSDLPEFADPRAKKGGTLYSYIQSFPLTTRIIGPDANGSFRPYLQDDVQVNLAHRHPDDTRIGPNGFHYHPGLAKQWAFDKKNKTVYVRLDPDARWSDGVPVKVGDFVFMFYFMLSAHIQQPWYNNFYSTTFSGLTLYDGLTFAIHVPEVRPDFSSRVLEMHPLAEHFYKELGPDFPQRYQWRVAPTTGAYTIRPEDIKKGQSITLTRVRDWWAVDKKFWRHRFNPDRIRFTVISDMAKAFEVFRKGELDSFNMNLSEYHYDKLPDTAPEVQNGHVAKTTFYNDTPRPTYGLWINSSRPLLGNRDVRIGINHASNWRLVIEKFARDDWTRMQTTSDGYGEFTHPALRARPYDIALAREAFARAGFTQTDADGVLKNGRGERLSFTLSTGYEWSKDILTILRQEALRCGLEFRLEVLDGSASWKKVQEKKHDIHFSAFGVSPEMYPRYWETWHSVNAYDKPWLDDGKTPAPGRKPKTQTNNLCCVAIPELDKLIDAYNRSESADDMKRMAFKMEEILHDDASFVPGYVMPFFRSASWRWIQIPEHGNVRIADSPGQYFLSWIDEDIKKQTRSARKSGEKLPPRIRVFDQYKLKE